MKYSTLISQLLLWYWNDSSFLFYLPNQGTQEKDKPEKEDDGGSIHSHFTHSSFIPPFLIEPASIPTKCISQQQTVPIKYCFICCYCCYVLHMHAVFCVCAGVLCRLLILRDGQMETPSKESSPLSNQGNWSVHYYTCLCLSSPPPLPSPSLPPLPLSLFQTRSLV